MVESSMSECYADFSGDNKCELLNISCCVFLFKCLDLNVGELQMYGTVTWLNALDELGKMKKGTDLITLVFIFKAGVVVLAQERVRGKKKTKVSQMLLHHSEQ